MRILMINKYAYVTGGADKQCLSLARLLREAGHEVAFLSVSSPRNVETFGSFVTCRVRHDTRDGLSAGERIRVLESAIWNREAANAMASIIREFHPDLVHAHKLYPQLSVSPIVSASRMSVPIVQTLHDYEFISASPYDDSGKWRDRLENRTSFRLLNTMMFAVRTKVHTPAVAAWIAVSNYVAGVHSARGISASVIHNFTDMESADSNPSLSERCGIAFVGTLSKEKGVMDVLEIARQLPRVRIVLAGRGPLEQVVVSASEGLPNVEFRGWLDSTGVRDVLSSARVAVVPSRWAEPGGLVVLEAMALGTPVVAYRKGGLDEYVSRTNAGIVVDASPSALAAACTSLLDDDARWMRCSESGLIATANEFSTTTHVRSVLEVYDRVLSER